MLLATGWLNPVIRAMEGLLLGLIAALTISLFDHYFWTLEFGVLFFWLLVGLNLKQLKRSS